MTLATAVQEAPTSRRRGRQFGLRRDLQLLHTLFFLGGSLTLLGSILWSLYWALFAYQTFGPAVVTRWASRPLPIAFAGLALALYSAVWLLRRRGLRVVVLPAGLRVIAPGQDVSLPWNQVERIWVSTVRYGLASLPSREQASLRIMGAKGESIRLDHALEGFAELVHAVKAHAYPHLLDRYRERLAEGASLDFGPLRLNGDAIHIGSRSYAWSQLHDATIHKGRLEIHLRDGDRVRKRRFALGRVPNADLCHQLLKNMEF